MLWALWRQCMPTAESEYMRGKTNAQEFLKGSPTLKEIRQNMDSAEADYSMSSAKYTHEYFKGWSEVVYPYYRRRIRGNL